MVCSFHFQRLEGIEKDFTGFVELDPMLASVRLPRVPFEYLLSRPTPALS
jgi:hypothetical protein